MPIIMSARARAFIARHVGERDAHDDRAVYDKRYVMPHPLRIEWRDTVDRLRSAQSLYAHARQYPLYYGTQGVATARKGVLHCLDDLWGVQSRVDMMRDQ